MIRKKHQEIGNNSYSTNNQLKNDGGNYLNMRMGSIVFIVLVLVGVAFSSGYFYAKNKGLSSVAVTTQAQPQAQQQAPQPAKPQISAETIKGLFAKNIIKFGNGDKKLVMVEVADPSCPYCHAAAGLNGSLNKQMGQQFILKADGGSYVAPVTEMRKLVDSGKADFAWIYTNGHGNGELATKALYCAFDQGKFWQAHDLLFSAKGYEVMNTQIKRDTTQTKIMADFLATKTDASQLKSCLDSGKYDARLGEESQLAGSLGVSGTPGFFLNTTNFSGAYSWTDMKAVADAELAK